ncbi:hypothetical protein CLV47_10158 [Antricoccus suffuscus]|uniref:Uncharacterized protein n=1 Tax=Antricoccus suffuscus TaxID=1629062 RepID=A0A2T1A5U2_9ACTN|nr:hypothetical protein CLV47_10158 [Antricoccus suffuscus]
MSPPSTLNLQPARRGMLLATRLKSWPTPMIGVLAFILAIVVLMSLMAAFGQLGLVELLLIRALSLTISAKVPQSSKTSSDTPH